MLPFNATVKQEFGAEVEQWVLQQLAANGYSARLISRWTAAFDLVIDGPRPVLVEVKAAHRRARRVRPGYYAPEWRWHVANLAECDHVLILVAEEEQGRRWAFVMPSWEAWQRQGLSITSHPERYRGRLAKYLDAWSTVEAVAGRVTEFQLTLF